MAEVKTSTAQLTPDSRYRSRKFIIGVASFLAATVMAWWGCWKLAKDAGDIALILGAWGACDAAILKLYMDANIKAMSE